MSTIRVWAPFARRARLITDEGARGMRPTGNGLFEAELTGTEYRVQLDDNPPRPDPRSAHQPEGVDGPSRLVNHGAFFWSDQDWVCKELRDSVVYELHVGTFTFEGTFDAVAKKLDHIVDLGVDFVELMPVAEFSGRRGWGYDGVDLYAPHHAYGGPEGLKRLVDACHARGLGVLLDVVYNHLGPVGNYLPEFGPYFTDRYRTPWGEAVNLDGAHSDDVRAFFIDNACMWLRDYHFDGLRIDAVHALIDSSARHFLEELAVRVDRLSTELGRALYLIPESDLNDPRLVKSRGAGGYGLHAQWSDDFHHSLHALLSGERSGYYEDFGDLKQVVRALGSAYVFEGDYSKFRHRRHGRPAVGLSGYRFVGYLQNHDQVGNRAVGERSGALMSLDRLQVGAALVLTSPFVPMLFMGEEWGATTPWLYFTDHADTDLGRAVAEGRRREFSAFGWSPDEVPDPQDPATFEASRLDWSEPASSPHRELLKWHKDLIALRRATPQLRDGRLDLIETLCSEEEQTLVVHRGPLILACNLSPVARAVTVAGEVMLASKSCRHDGEQVVLEPDSVVIAKQ